MNGQIRVCIIGSGFVGKKHAIAYKSRPEAKLQVVCDINQESAKKLAAEYDFERVETNWRDAITAKDVDLVCICAPNNVHFEMVSLAIKYNKHVLCEKPLGLTAGDSDKLVLLSQKKDITVACCYNILHIPAITYVHKIIKSEKLGKIVSFRGRYDNDRLASPDIDFEWRMLKKNATGGSLCDLAINILAVSQFLVGDIVSVCGMADIVYAKRKDANGDFIEVENDDIAQFICRYKNGAMGYISSNRVAPGSKQDMQFEIQFTEGAIRFSLERMNEIQIYYSGERGFSTVISDENGWFCVGYEELKVLDAIKMLNNIKNKKCSNTDFGFAAKIDHVIESVLDSIEKKSWIEVKYDFQKG